MIKKITYISTATPDPQQGGTGIINYYLIKELIDRKYIINAYFFIPIWFKKALNYKILESFKSKYFKYKIINIANYDNNNKFDIKLGSSYVDNIYSSKQVEDVLKNLNGHDKIFSTNFGLAKVIAKYNFNNSVCMLDDPLQLRLRANMNFNFFRISAYYTLLAYLSIDNYFFWTKIVKEFSKIKKLFIVSPQSYRYYKKKGVKNITYQRWFSNKVDKKDVIKTKKIFKTIRLLHVGDLRTSASQKLLSGLKDFGFKEFNKVNINFEIVFIGKYDKKITTDYKNIKLKYLGSLNNITKYYKQSHYFFTPFNYDVGVRTRIIEALAYGLPCISHHSSNFGLPELKNNKTVIFFKNYDEMKKIFSNKDTSFSNRKRMSERCRKLWEEKFNTEKNIKKIANLL